MKTERKTIVELFQGQRNFIALSIRDEGSVEQRNEETAYMTSTQALKLAYRLMAFASSQQSGTEIVLELEP